MKNVWKNWIPVIDALNSSCKACCISAADPSQLPFFGPSFASLRSDKTMEKHSISRNSYPPKHLCCQNIDAGRATGNFQYSRKLELLNFLWLLYINSIILICPNNSTFGISFRISIWMTAGWIFWVGLESGPSCLLHGRRTGGFWTAAQDRCSACTHSSQWFWPSNNCLSSWTDQWSAWVECWTQIAYFPSPLSLQDAHVYVFHILFHIQT